MTIGIDGKGNVIEIYGLSASSGGGGDTGTEYTAKNPISITNNKIGLKIDNQTLQVNTDGQLVANLDELGNEVNTIANAVNNKQDTLVSGQNIKTINNQSILGSGNITIEGGSAVDEQYGIKGDYATQYGILECPNGILTVSDMTVTLKQGVVMQCAGQDIKTTVASDMTHTITATNDIDLFYAGGSILECGDVFYQESEPDNGTANYIAWWQPSKGKWQFKSNETGNVYREAIACRLAHIHTDGTTITRVDYIGNRILDDEIFVETKNIKTINGQSIIGTGDITISGGTVTPTIYTLGDTTAGDSNLDTVAVGTSANSITSVPVCSMEVASGWYIVTYKGMLSFVTNEQGTKATAILQTIGVNSPVTDATNQVYSGFVGASRNNTYYAVTSIMKVNEGEKLQVSVQQYSTINSTVDNHTRGFVAYRIGDI